MKPPFFLVPDTVSHDTVEALQMLLERAKAGEVLGVGYVALLRRRLYIANTAGEAHRNPTFTRGMLRALDDQLALRIRGGHD